MQIWQDLTYGLRLLGRSPVFTLVATLSLALGIGANTTIFSVVDALMLRRLPVRNAEKLVAITTSDAGPYSNYPAYERYRELTQLFSGVSAICLVDRYNVKVNNSAGAAEASQGGQVGIALVSGNYFSTLGVDTILGRPFTTEDDQSAGGNPVTVVSYNYWERQLGRSADIVGRTLTMNATTYTIVGVAPRGFTGDWIGQPSDLWIPLAMQPQVMPEKNLLTDQRANWVRVVAALKPGVTTAQAEAATKLSYQQLLTERASANLTPQDQQKIAASQVVLVAADKGFAPKRESFGQPLAIILILVGVVLLIACANVANLLLARAAARTRELTVRVALGAGRSRIIRQLLTESLLLVLLGGALGLLFALWGTNSLARFLGSGLPRVGFATPVAMDLDLHLSVRMLAFTVAISVATGLLFGLVPAFRASRLALTASLNSRGVDSMAGTRFGLGKGLVVLQVALSLVLLVGAGLFARTLRNLKQQDVGLDREHLLLVWTAPMQVGRSGAETATLYETAQQRIALLPGVISASPSNAGLVTGGGMGAPSEVLTVEGQVPKSGLSGGLGRAAVGPKFFETVGMQFLSGRDFSAEENKETAPRVAVINETLARFEFGEQNPIGRRFIQRGDKTPWEIIGVVRSGKDRNLREQNLGMVYVPYHQLADKLQMMFLAVRTHGNPAAVSARVRQELRDIDVNLPVLNIDTAEEQIDGVLVQERLAATVGGIFSVLAALLASLGLYGVISYTVTRRSSEIGIRLALGATPAQVLRMVLRESLALVLFGIAAGLVTALATTRFMSAMLFGVGAADPLVIGMAILLMIVVATLAALLPARRAASVDPLVALRYE